MKLLKFSAPYIRRKKWFYFLYFSLSIVVTFFSIALTYITGQFINHVTYATELETLIKIIIYMAILRISVVIMKYILTIVNVELQTDLSFFLAKDLIDNIHHTYVSRCKSIDPAYLNQRISADAASIFQFSINTTVGIIIKIVSFISIGFIISMLSKKVTVIFAIFFIIYVIVYYAMKKPFHQLASLMLEKQSVYFSQMQEQLQHVEFVKIFSLHQFFKKRLNKAYSFFRNSYMKFRKFATLFSSLDSAVLAIAQIVLYLVGAIEIINGRLLVGSFVIIATYFKQMLDIGSYFFNIGKTYQKSLVAYDRIPEIQSWPREPSGTITLTDEIYEIKTSSLSFSYKNNNIFKDKSLTFQKGFIYGISGKNGAGKSTFIQNLIGLFSNEMIGDVLYNNISISNINMDTLRHAKIGYAEQDPTLLHDTIRNNFLLDTEFDKIYMNKIAQMLHLNLLFEKLPNGTNTLIAPQNNNLSGGEKQKINLLRVILKNPDVYIFDEPTTALDQMTIDNLINFILEEKRNKIIIIVSHDHTVLDICDVLYHF